MSSNPPLITIAIPSFNQGAYLDQALNSIFSQKIPLEVFVLDGGSQDNTLEVIHRWESQLAGWRSHKDKGQAAAINEGIALGKAPFVCWLNSDDWFLPQALEKLSSVLKLNSNVPVVYGKAYDFYQKTGKFKPIWVEAFNASRLAKRCIISQPATLIRREAWEEVNGLNQDLYMAMDYDLWWRLFKVFGPFQFIDQFFAINRVHLTTKTNTYRKLHYREAIAVVKKHYGSIPWKWWLLQPYAVWLKTITNQLKRLGQ